MMGIYRLTSMLGYRNINYPQVFGGGVVDCSNWDNLSDAILNTSGGNIFIGDGTFFGHGVMLLTGKHLNNHPYLRVWGNGIIIGDRCWIASGVIVLGGIHVGDDCTISAGSIVTKDVPDDTVVKGVW